MYIEQDHELFDMLAQLRVIRDKLRELNSKRNVSEIDNWRWSLVFDAYQELEHKIFNYYR